MCKCVHFQIIVIETPMRDQYIQCLQKEGKKEEGIEEGKGRSYRPDVTMKKDIPVVLKLLENQNLLEALL